MIDYLEERLEEETAVELTGRPLLPVGRQKALHWEEEEKPFRSGERIGQEAPAEGGVVQEDQKSESGRPSRAEDTGVLRSGAVRLLDRLRRAELAAGAIRQQGSPLAVTFPGEAPQAGKTDLHAIDRAVQRDARRYDGGFSLY